MQVKVSCGGEGGGLTINQVLVVSLSCKGFMELISCHVLLTHGVIGMLCVFQVTGSCRVMNSSPPRFRLNSSPREAAYNTRAEKVTKSRHAATPQRESCTHTTMKISNLYIIK